MSDDMTNAEYEEYKRNLKEFKEVFAKDPEGTAQAFKDAMQLPRKSGDIE